MTNPTPCRVPEGLVDVVLSYCHNTLHSGCTLNPINYPVGYRRGWWTWCCHTATTR